MLGGKQPDRISSFGILRGDSPGLLTDLTVASLVASVIPWIGPQLRSGGTGDDTHTTLNRTGSAGSSIHLDPSATTRDCDPMWLCDLHPQWSGAGQYAGLLRWHLDSQRSLSAIGLQRLGTRSMPRDLNFRDIQGFLPHSLYSLTATRDRVTLIFNPLRFRLMLGLFSRGDL